MATNPSKRTTNLSTMANHIAAYQYQFPVSTRARDAQESEHIDQVAHSFCSASLSEHTVLIAWAILLRSYLNANAVGFLHLCNPPRNGYTNGAAASTAGHLLNFCQVDLYGKKNTKGIEIRSLAITDTPQFVGGEDFTIVRYNDVGYQQGPSDDTAITLSDFRATLLLDVVCTAGNHFFKLRYRRSGVSAQYARTILLNFSHICLQLNRQSETPIEAIDVISNDIVSLLTSWNPEKLFVADNCMHDLVEVAAAVRPQAEAVASWDGNLSYSQLFSIASKVAVRLANVGVGCGDFIPFAFEKSMWTVVATLAILMTGAAFVPLEPTHPESRLHDILVATKARLVITSEKYLGKFKTMHENVVVVSSQTVDYNIGRDSNISKARNSQPDDAMLVLFTSGSTGKPKGMVLTHRAICTHAIAHGSAMNYQNARVLQFAAHTFDVAVMDIFTTLIHGGCICIPSEEQRHGDIAGAIESLQVDLVILTPSYAGLLDPRMTSRLKTLAIGGEIMAQEVVDRWACAVDLIQIYGPAEVGICLLNKMLPGKTKSLTVGRPLRNCSCWLVEPDDPNRLAQIGAVGELVVASPSLALGYLNNEAKTRELFLSRPRWADTLCLSESRFYRTGDLLKYNLDAFDGTFDFVGRKDHQIKLNGQRLEPGEVEHQICSCPEVANAVVMKPVAGCFADTLIAVVQIITKMDTEPQTSILEIIPDQHNLAITIQEVVSRNLPSFMVPSHVLLVKNLPRVPSLKLDRPAIKRWLESFKVLSDANIFTNRHASLGLSILRADENVAHAISKEIVSMLGVTDDQEAPLSSRDLCIQDVSLTSIQLISLSLYLKNTFDTKVPMSLLWRSETSVRTLADYIARNGSEARHRSFEDFLSNKVRLYTMDLSKLLDRQTSIIRSPTQLRKRHIFVTGSTGYLGIAILRQLLQYAEVTVHAMVRCDYQEEGLQRIVRAAKEAYWWKDSYYPRLRVVKGDLSRKDLGLSLADLDMLHGRTMQANEAIDCIVHNGARVHYSASFDALASVNVEGTMHLLEAAGQSSQIAHFVYISGGTRPSIDGPADNLDMSQEVGYAQTKYVGDVLVRQAALHSRFERRSVTIFRPGYIIGSANNGKANNSDFIWRLIAGCVDIGAFNINEASHWVFVSDVDSVAAQIARLAIYDGHGTSGCATQDVQHEQVLTGICFGTLWRILQNDFGYKLVGLDESEWLDSLVNRVKRQGEEHLLYPLLHVLERDGKALGSAVVPHGYEISDDVIQRNIDYLIGIGFMPRPSVAV